MQTYMSIIHTMKQVMSSKKTRTASPRHRIHAGEAGHSEACKIIFVHANFKELVNNHPEEAPADFA